MIYFKNSQSDLHFYGRSSLTSVFLRIQELQDDVANLLDSEDISKYRIPLSIGDVEIVLDRKGQDSVKVIMQIFGT